MPDLKTVTIDGREYVPADVAGKTWFALQKADKSFGHYAYGSSDDNMVAALIRETVQEIANGPHVTHATGPAAGGAR